MTPELDAQILQTIAAIQTRDARVYDANTRFFTNEQLDKAKQEWKRRQAQAKKEGKKYTLKDYERDVLLEHGGYVENEDEANTQTQVKTHQEEQDELKEAFKVAAGTVDDDSDDGDDLLIKREKTAEELEAEEEEYKEYLLQNIAVSSPRTASGSKKELYLMFCGSELER